MFTPFNRGTGGNQSAPAKTPPGAIWGPSMVILPDDDGTGPKQAVTVATDLLRGLGSTPRGTSGLPESRDVTVWR